jgi:hypothetical protein
MPDGTYVATRWITVFFVPIIPLAAYLIFPTGRDRIDGQATSSFLIIDRTPLNPLRILRTYLLAVVGLAPISLGGVNSSTLIRILGGPKAFLAMLCVLRGHLHYLCEVEERGKAYKIQTPSEG